MKVDKINKAPNIKGVRHSYLLYESIYYFGFCKIYEKK